ncbi:hypothetical protein P3T20_006598 [Paraburkholderia sp. GAS206C]|uniref:hypothetical protein n=1 Tax=unclassified Paraburkholderia TaxID=2615204 RepID=UPI003D1A4EB0
MNLFSYDTYLFNKSYIFLVGTLPACRKTVTLMPDHAATIADMRHIRFPPDTISRAVRPYYRLLPSLHMVEELLAARHPTHVRDQAKSVGKV